MKRIQIILTLLVFTTSLIFVTNSVNAKNTNSFNVLSPKSIMGTSYYTTTQDGYWHQSASWNGAGIPPTSGSNNIDITIHDNITYDGTVSGDPMDFRNKFTLTVKSGATLEIFADVTINNNFTFIVEAGGNLIIHGSMSMGNVIEGVIDGAVDIEEDLTINGGGNSSAITGTGTLEVGGTVTDPNGIVLPALINNERYLVVDGGSWTDINSWSNTSGGTAGVTVPSDQSRVYIESEYDVTIPSTVLLQDITISNGSVVTVNPGATLEVTNITNSGEIVLSASGSGSAALLYDGSTPGKISFFRHVTAKAFKYVSSPYTNAPYTDFFTTPYDAKNYNFYEYIETTVGPAVYGWTTKTSGQLSSGKGYAIYYSRDYAYPLTGDTLRTGDYSVNVTNTSSGTPDDDGWNLIGNPYAANIDADAFLSANNGGVIDGTIYYWDDDGSDGNSYSASDYSTYTLAGGVAGDNGTVPNGFIAPGQAFFLKAVANGSINFNNSMKVASSGTVFKSASVANTNTKQLLRLTLVNENSDYNETLLTFAEGYTLDYDNFYDGKKKLQSGKIAFYSLTNQDKLAIQALPIIQDNIEINLGVSASAAGIYTISAKSVANFDILTDILLYDKLLGETTDLRVKNYSFATEGTVEDRFAVKFIQKEQIFTIWEGNIEDNFFDETKWSNGIPSAEKSVLIPSGTNAQLNGYLTCRDLTVQSGATLGIGESSYLEVQNGIEVQAKKDNEFGIILAPESIEVNAKVVFEMDKNNFNDFSSPVNKGTLNEIIGSNNVSVNSFAPLQNKWNDVTNIENVFSVGTGYQVLNNTIEHKTYSLNGTLNAGHHSFYLNEGFNYVGNPYLSYIDSAFPQSM